MSSASFSKQLRWSWDCGQGPGKLFQADGPAIAKAGCHASFVGDAVRAVDFAQRNGDVSCWTVGHGKRRGTEVPDRSDDEVAAAFLGPVA